MVIMSKGNFDPPGSWSNKVEGVVQDQRWHCQRPLANVKHYVEAFSRPGDLVVDPFMGSGTTAVACAQLSRSFVGCDIVRRVLRCNSYETRTGSQWQVRRRRDDRGWIDHRRITADWAVSQVPR